MAAAVLLPGLHATPVQAQADSSVSLQSARLHEAARTLGNGLPSPAGLSAQTLSVQAVTPLGDSRRLLQLQLTQDSWSGATPVSTAPAVAGGNRAVQRGSAGQLVTVGASPMITGSLLLDAQDRPLRRDATTGTLQPAPELVHTLSTASPETRRQLDLKLSQRRDDGQLSLGGSASDERDFRSQSLNLARRFDDGESSLSFALSATRSRVRAVLDHDALPYITRRAYADHITVEGGQTLLHGRRREASASAGWSRALTPSALAEATLSLTRSSGDLANPYKLTSVVFAPTAGAGADGVRSGELRSLMEQRPSSRLQWNVGARLVLHHAASDAAWHLGGGLFSDDWGVRGQRLQVEWLQPLSPAGTLSLLLRHHSQHAARFYVPWLVSHQAYRQVSVTPDGQLQARDHDPALLPAHFSSDTRLSAFGTLTAGLGYTHRLAGGATLDLSVDRTRQSGRLKWGGGGEGRHADLDHWTAQATLNLVFEAGAAPSREHDHDHGPGSAAHGHDAAPASLMGVHAAPGRGRWMLGLRQQQLQQSGTLRHGTQAADDTRIAAGACGGAPCLSVPTAMRMRMAMLDLMVGLDEHWSLMLMPQFMDMAMNSRLLPGAVAGDTPVHVGQHESHGLGDTQLHLLRHGGSAALQWSAGLGLSAPTGRSNLAGRRSHQRDGAPLDPGMQPGSGTWDALSTLSAWGPLGDGARGRWGLQASGASRLQAANDQGWARGWRWQLQGWAAWRATPALSLVGRAGWRVDHGVAGTVADADSPTSPVDLAANQGGRLAELGLGLNARLGGAGQLALERTQPLHTRLRGWQLPPRGGWALQWSQAL